MPSSSEAVTGRYNPLPVPEQNYNRDQPLQDNTVNVNVDDIAEIPSQSDASNLKMGLITGGLATLAFAAVCVVIVVPTVAATKGHTSSSSSTGSSTDSSSTGSSLTTLGTSSASTISIASTTTLAAGFSAGGAVLSGSSAYYGYEQVTINCTANLNNITITIYVQKTVGATYSGAFSTFWGGTMNQAYVDNGTQIIYTWTIISGQTIQASGSPYAAQAQFSLVGVSQTTSADIYTVRATTVGGVTSSFSGHF